MYPSKAESLLSPPSPILITKMNHIQMSAKFNYSTIPLYFVQAESANKQIFPFPNVTP